MKQTYFHFKRTNMNTIKSLGFAAVLATCSTFAQAEVGPYGGVSAVLANYEAFGADLDLNIAQAQFGYRANENAAIEVRAGTSFSDESISAPGGEITLEADYLVSVFTKFIAPVGPLELYALVGGTYAKLELGVGQLSASDSDSDLSYGAGLSFNPTENTSLFLEYLSLYDKNDQEISGITLGFNSRF